MPTLVRVERIDNGKGPYSEGPAMSWFDFNADPQPHPAPASYAVKDAKCHRFAFPSWDALHRWFTAEQRLSLHEQKFVIKLYEAEPWWSCPDGNQCTFDVTSAKLVATLPLAVEV